MLGDRSIEQLGRRLVADLRAAGELDHLGPERRQDVPVGGVAGPRDRDAIVGIERREEREHERA